MKKYIFILLFVPSLASATISRVQASSAAVDSSNLNTVTLPSTPTNGNNEIACIGVDSATATNSVLSQVGSTWTIVAQFQDSVSSTTTEVWVSTNVKSAGTTITVTTKGGNVANGAVVAEYSGMNTGNVFDTSSQNSVGSGATITDTGLTTATSVPNEVWVSCTFQHAAVSSLTGGVPPALITPDNGYTLVAQVHTSLGATLQQWKNTGYMDKIVTAAGQAGNTCTTDQSGTTHFRYTAIATAFTSPTPSSGYAVGMMGGM